MTQQERIEQAAREYLDSRISDWDVKDLELVKGAYRYLLSHLWISVDEELPKDFEIVFLRAVGRNDSVCYGTGYINLDDWYTDIQRVEQDYFKYKITHWMHKPEMEGGEK